MSQLTARTPPKMAATTTCNTTPPKKARRTPTEITPKMAHRMLHGTCFGRVSNAHPGDVGGRGSRGVLGRFALLPTAEAKRARVGGGSYFSMPASLTSFVGLPAEKYRHSWTPNGSGCQPWAWLNVSPPASPHKFAVGTAKRKSPDQLHEDYHRFADADQEAGTMQVREGALFATVLLTLSGCS